MNKETLIDIELALHSFNYDIKDLASNKRNKLNTNIMIQHLNNRFTILNEMILNHHKQLLNN